jgi:hypothetical protein
MAETFKQSEMALLIECWLKCAPILIDNAAIVREAMLQQLAFVGRFAAMIATLGRIICLQECLEICGYLYL